MSSGPHGPPCHVVLWLSGLVCMMGCLMIISTPQHALQGLPRVLSQPRSPFS